MTRRSPVERWCSVCEREVVELSAMTEARAQAFLAANAGERVCVAYRVDRAGQVRFREPPTPPLAAAGLSVALALAASGCLGFEGPDLEAPDEPEPEVWASYSSAPERSPEPSSASEPVFAIESREICEGLRALPMPTADSELGQLVVIARDVVGRPIADAAIRVVSREGEIEGRTNDLGIWTGELAHGVHSVRIVSGNHTKWTSLGVQSSERSTVWFRLDPERRPPPPPEDDGELEMGHMIILDFHEPGMDCEPDSEIE
ncbi:hypothetical protein ACNOYE_03220 [Nannocystaceae bacterium ST9]